MTKKDISTEEIEKLPLRGFEGKIVVVDSDELMNIAESELKSANIIGFDTETKPSFKKGQINKVALLQLATEDTAWLFRLNKTGVPEYVCDILSDPEVLKIGVAIHDDLIKIKQLARIEPKGFVELQSFVEKFNIECKSLKKLAALILNIKVSKAQRLSNWESEDLSAAQQKYAATDAWAAYKIYDRLICNN